MKLADLLALIAAPETGDDMLNLLMQTVMTADDITKDERSSVALGFMAGCSYALAKANEGDASAAARTLLRLQKEWEASGVI